MDSASCHVVVRLLRLLAKKAEDERKGYLDPHLVNMSEQLRGVLPPIPLNELERMPHMAQGNFGGDNRWVHLPRTLRHELLPVLTLRWAPSGLWVHMVLVGRDVSVAYRFEGPEEGEGRHSFPHAQMLDALGVDASIKCLAMLAMFTRHTSQPSLPLDAPTDVGLLLAALVTAYGGEIFTWIQEWGIQGTVGPHVAGMAAAG